MKRFWGFIKKEAFHIFRDRRTLIILFGMPIVQITLFGFALNNEIKDIKLAFLDPSKDELTLQIKNKLSASGYFILVDNVRDELEIEKLFRQGKIREAVIFEPGFAEKIKKENKGHILILADATDPNTANLIVAYTQAVVQAFQQSLQPASMTQPAGLLKGGLPVINAEIRMLYNPQLESVYMFIPGLIALIIILVSALMTSISIAREKELGSMEVLLVSPLKPMQIILGKVLPYLLLSFSIALFILFLGSTIFAVPIRGSLMLLLSECLLYSLTTLSLGLLISSLVDSQQAAMMASLLGLMLPSVLLSGFIFPVTNMPYLLQLLSHISPAKWFIIIIKGIMYKEQDFSQLWEETLILFGMTTIFLTVALAKFKRRLDL